MSITAFIPNYNEERRLPATLACLGWVDEILVLDKGSTDRSLEIIRSFPNTRVIGISETEYDPGELKYMLEARGDWVLIITASDVLHPALAKALREIDARGADYPYDFVNVPYQRYVLGISEPWSPWYSTFHSSFVRKSAIRVRDEDAHKALDLSGLRKGTVDLPADQGIHHLTHETMEILCERHFRYWRSDARLWPKDRPVKPAFLDIVSAAGRLLLRRTWLAGWRGVALASLYLSYYLMRFAFIWEKCFSNAPAVYQRKRQEIVDLWKTPPR